MSNAQAALAIQPLKGKSNRQWMRASRARAADDRGNPADCAPPRAADIAPAIIARIR